MPALKSIWLECLFKVKKLTLDAPRLLKIKVLNCSDSNSLKLNLEIVHGESVETLIIDKINQVELKKLKNLKFLHSGRYMNVDSTLLVILKQEIF